MKTLVTICAVTALIMVMNGSAAATPTTLIGGFNGVEDGWVGSDDGVTPGTGFPSGATVVTTANLGGYAVTPSEGTGFLLLGPDGTQIYKFNVLINAGDVLEFDYATGTDDGYVYWSAYEQDYGGSNSGSFTGNTLGQWQHGSFDLSQWAGLSGVAIGFGFTNAALDNITVPEPATMALLGLGGLLFARKKK